MSDYCKVTIQLDDPHVSCEHVWCTPLGGNRYRMENIPVFIQDVSIDDIIEAEPKGDGYPIYTKVVERKRRTVLIEYDLGDIEDEQRRQRLKVFNQQAEEHDIKVESMMAGILCAAIPIDTFDEHVDKLHDFAETADMGELELTYADA